MNPQDIYGMHLWALFQNIKGHFHFFLRLNFVKVSKLIKKKQFGNEEQTCLDFFEQRLNVHVCLLESQEYLPVQ